MRLLELLMVGLLIASTGAFAQDFPNPPPCDSCFVGTLRLLANPQDVNTKILAQDLYFVDSNKVVWKAGKGDVTDGASIPPLFQPIIGGPWEADYLPAAVMHDHYCDDQHRVRAWRATDRMFYEAMIVNHTDVIKAKTMYYAVYAFGPHWGKLKSGQKCGPNCVFQLHTGVTYQPADYAPYHQPELDQVQQKIRDSEVRGQPLSLDDLEALAAKNHPLAAFILEDDTK